MMEIIGIIIYVCAVGGAFYAIWYLAQLRRQSQYLKCWMALEEDLVNWVDEYRDNHYEEAIVKQSRENLENIRSYLNTYSGPVDIHTDKRISISQDNLFVREIHRLASDRWWFGDSVLSLALTTAIDHYNQDEEKEVLTLAQFISCILELYEDTFVNNLLDQHPL